MELNINITVTAQVVLLARESAMAGHAAEAELHAFLQAQDTDTLTSLVALMWIGRGSFDSDEWHDARATAQAEATTPTDDYLMGTPHLAENLEAGMEAMGLSVSEAEASVLR